MPSHNLKNLTVIFLFFSSLLFGEKQIQNKNFTVYFEKNVSKQVVDEVLKSAIKWREILIRDLDISFPERTHILLNVDERSANGFMLPIPGNVISLNLVPPMGDFSLSGFGEEWISSIVLHELAHNFHLNRKDTFWGKLSYVFGPGLNGVAMNFDRWNVEGFATFLESVYQSGSVGRLNKGTFRQIALHDASTGKFPNFNEMVISPHHWLLDTSSYLYGSLFIEYLANKYGKEKLFKYMKGSTGWFYPFKDVAFKKQYQKWPKEEWNDFKKSYMELAINVPGQRGAVSLDVIDHKLHTPRDFVVTEDFIHYQRSGKSLLPYYIQKNLYSQSIKTKIHLYRGHYGFNLWGDFNSGEIIFSKLTFRGTKKQLETVVSRKKGIETVLKHFYGSIWLTVFSESKNIIVLEYLNGHYLVHHMNDRGKVYGSYPLDKNISYVSDLKVSPDETKFLLSAVRDGVAVVLQISKYDLNKNTLADTSGFEVLPLGDKFKYDFSYSVSNELLYGQENDLGEDQIYRYTVQGIEQLTDNPFGAWKGQLYKGELFFYVLSDEGFSLVKKKIDSKQENIFKRGPYVGMPTRVGINMKDLEAVFYRFITNSEIEVSPFKITEASPLTLTRPYFWYPLISLSLSSPVPGLGLGVKVLGENLFSTFKYDLSLSYLTPLYAILFTYQSEIDFDILEWQFSLSVLRALGTPTYRVNIGNFLTLPFSLPYQDFTFVRLHSYVENNNLGTSHYLGLSSFGSSLVRMRRNTIPTEGYSYFFRANVFSPAIGSLYSFQTLQFDFHAYIPLHSLFVFHLKGGGGLTFKEGLMPKQPTFGITGIYSGDLILDFSSFSLPLRFISLPVGYHNIVYFGIDGFITLYNNFKTLRKIPWLMFQNIALDVFYEGAYGTVFGIGQVYEHGVGLALDMKVLDLPRVKINTGLCYGISSRTLSFFLNLVY